MGEQKTRVIREPHLLLSIAASVGLPVINYVPTGVHDGFLIFDNLKFKLEFGYYWLTSYKKEWKKYGQPGSQVNLNSSIVENTSIGLPTIPEQDKIIMLLSKVEDHLSLLQQEVHLKTLLKRELLQRLLTNTENNVPKIRFKNYNDSWKNTTLEEVADIKTGSRNHQDSIKDGKYPFFVRSEKIEHLNEYDFNETAILVPGDGKIGEIFHYYQGKFALHQRVYKIDNFKNINSMFLLNLFKSNFRQHALRLNAQGTVPSLRLPMFTKWKIAFPTLSEQKQIAKLLNMVDTSIKAKKRRIKRLSMLKKFLLQNMFV